MNFPDIPTWLRTRLMVALILTAALAFGLRFNDLLNQTRVIGDTQYNTDSLIVGAIEPAAGDAAPSDAALPEAGTVAPIADGAPAATPPAPTDWKDASDSEIEYSAVQMQLFEDLSKRRMELDAQEKDLATREALLKAAERNLEQKYKELSSLSEEIKALLETQSEEEDARITSLVKIYEGMKAKDAARIFNTLDMDVLMQVLGRMSERKSAPIIAAMEPERARSVTIMLAEQKSLPTLDNILGTP